MNKKVFNPLLLCFCLDLSSLMGKDFGLRGELFPIVEENLILVLQKRLSSNPSHNPVQPLLKKIEEKAKHPKLKFVPPNATKNRTFHYDPSYTVPASIKNEKGIVIVQQGTKINPLKHLPLSSTLLFFDGNNPAHIQWAEAQKDPTKWILVDGNPFKLEEQKNRPVYFDQNGFLIDKFKLEHIPARLSQDGLLLKIEEVSLQASEALS